MLAIGIDQEPYWYVYRHMYYIYLYIETYIEPYQIFGI